MTYIDGFVAAVPNADREQYKRHAEEAAKVLGEHVCRLAPAHVV